MVNYNNFKNLKFKNLESSLADRIIRNFFGGFTCWDSKQFLHISEFGYVWESNLAFFPLFPTILRIFGNFLSMVFTFMNFYSAMLLSGVLLNNVSFLYILLENK